MGTNKALLRYGSGTLVQHIASEVRIAVGSATVVGPADIYLPLGLPAIPDLRPDLGPMGGVATALTGHAADLSMMM